MEYKLYIIESPNINKVYIGITSKSLGQRFSGHKRTARKHSQKYCSSKDIIRAGNCTIRLLETHNDKITILQREKYYINDVYGGICTNILKNNLGEIQ